MEKPQTKTQPEHTLCAYVVDLIYVLNTSFNNAIYVDLAYGWIYEYKPQIYLKNHPLRTWILLNSLP